VLLMQTMLVTPRTKNSGERYAPSARTLIRTWWPPPMVMLWHAPSVILKAAPVKPSVPTSSK
jgi:hypothetical protein